MAARRGWGGHRLGSLLIGLLIVFSFMPVATGYHGSFRITHGYNVYTPFGPMPAARVVGVPSGTTILPGNSLVFPNETEVTINLPTVANVEPPATYSGWIEDADWTYSSTGNSIGEFSASWTLPGTPSAGLGGIIYLFPGLQPSSSSQIIIQPVLQWGYNGEFGGNYWDMASWFCNDCGSETGTYFYSTPMEVTYPDLSGQLIGYPCTRSNGECDWTITGTQFENGEAYTTTLSYGSHAQLQSLGMYWSALALEAYNIQECQQFPSGSVTFSDLYFNNDGPPWIYPTPSWGTQIYYNNCGTAVTVNSPYSVTLTF